MNAVHKRTLGHFVPRAVLFGVIVIGLTTGCAKLPLDNTAPAAPVLSSNGLVSSFGVEVVVLVDDVDGDKVTVQLKATPAGGSIQQQFAWTSFFPSGQEESFFITLPVGQWQISAQARDEMNEESVSSGIDLTVSLP